jgi:hypothetical protein
MNEEQIGLVNIWLEQILSNDNSTLNNNNINNVAEEIYSRIEEDYTKTVEPPGFNEILNHLTETIK